MRIGEALNWGEKLLLKAKVENAKMETLWLFSSAVGSQNNNSLQLYFKRNEYLSQENFKNFRKKVSARTKRLPLSYLLGTQEFFGLPFSVNSDVLIPRPETELLVENTLNQIKNLKKVDILEIGTGSGNIAIALARYCPSAKIVTVDCSAKALRTAKKNARLNDVFSKITFLRGSLYQPLEKKEMVFDLIVSNPPYISEKDFHHLQREVRYEPEVALWGGKNGLEIIEKIIIQSTKYLKNGGTLLIEIGYNQSRVVKNMMEQVGFVNIKTVRDHSGIERVIIGEKSENNG